MVTMRVASSTGVLLLALLCTVATFSYAQTPVQYTPDQANWTTWLQKPLDAGNRHDPNGITWISEANWNASRWDGTIYNPQLYTRQAFALLICPSGDRIRGLRDEFYRHNPFADVLRPTKAEVDNWHRLAINHIRRLVGYNTTDREIVPDRCLFARALWGDERKFTTLWNAKYPSGTLNGASGPCTIGGGTNAHCGASFLPNATDQAPYLPAGTAACGLPSGSEGVFGSPKPNIAWSLNFGRAFCSTLGQEGFWGGHTGPWFHREKFGFSFWDTQPTVNNNVGVLRAKWGGTLMPSLYCDPSTAGCVVTTTAGSGSTTTAGSGSSSATATATVTASPGGSNVDDSASEASALAPGVVAAVATLLAASRL